MDFEDFIKELALLDASDKLTALIDLVSAYFQQLSTLKTTDKARYDQILNFKYISDSTVKALEFLLANSQEKHLPITPVVNLLVVHKDRNNVSIVIRPVLHGLGKFYRDLGDEEVKLAIRDYVMESVGLIGFSELTKICSVIELMKHKDVDVLVKLCDEEMTYRRDKNFGTVLKMISRAGLRDRFDVHVLIKVAVELNQVEQIHEVVKEDADLVSELLVSLKPNVHSKYMKKIIKVHGLDHNDFPGLLRHQRHAYFKYIIANFDWSTAEEKATMSVEDLKVVIGQLERKGMKNQAYSVYYRNQERLKGLPQLDKYKNGSRYKLIKNKLQQQDAFLSTSYIRGVASDLPYLLLSDFNIHRCDVHFVNSGNLDLAIEYLKNHHTLGIDCEFYNTDSTSFSETRLATMQIATREQVYVFDCLELITHPDFKAFVLEILESPDYMIIGHTFKSDTDVIRHSLGLESLTAKNVINVETLYAKNNKVSLAKMVTALLNMSLCKYEQTGSWSRRPLREAQLHYAALDAVVLLVLYDKLNNTDGTLETIVSEISEPKPTPSIQKKKTLFNPKPLPIKTPNPAIKFITDCNLNSLATKMQIWGMDTEINKDYKDSDFFKVAEAENRIIITKDPLLTSDNPNLKILCLQTTKTGDRCKEIAKVLEQNVQLQKLSPRCKFCNSQDIIKTEVLVDGKKVKGLKRKYQIDCKQCSEVYMLKLGTMKALHLNK